ncbi:GntR family transcriptional regulator [Ahrensia kielensis]|uniref:GntR family transcriptional regulator n=1 Tax=Ahrensia kielensis TaxID=76980 RepID=UPI00037921A7|nr:GntR family transcriptional regulator [Ahrensia kielensis]
MKTDITNTSSLADKAYNVLRRAVLTNVLVSESLWSDRELCEKFDLSRTPVREAILRLQLEQLVQIVPRKGMRVMPLRLEDVRDIHQVTKALELEAALLIAKSENRDEVLAIIKGAVEEMERAMQAKDRDAWVLADTRCHFAVVDKCGNKRLADMYHAQRGLTDRARYFVLHIRDLPMQSTVEHRQMYEALLNRDSQALERLYRQHWDRTTEEMLAIIEHHTSGLANTTLKMSAGI